MALRSGYKGFKKVINGLKVFRPGVLGLDLGTGLAVDASGKLKVTGDLRDYAPNIKANTKLISESIWGSHGKNLNVYPYVFNSSTADGITATTNEDGSVNINGTATAGTSFLLHTRAGYSLVDNHPIILPEGRYYVTKDLTNVGLRLLDTVSGAVHTILELGNNDLGGFFELEETTQIGITVNIGNGVVFNNDILHVMILDPNCLDTSYEPYHVSAVKSFASKSIECDKTAAGTYTLSATVDAQGAVTYEWTAVTP